MKKEDLRYFQTIGKIQNCVSKAETFDEAVRDGLKIILDNSMADYAVLWYAVKEDQNVIRPFYWLCPVDLTSAFYQMGDGIVGRVCAEKKTELIGDPTAISETEKDLFSGLEVSSLLCIPFSIGDKLDGCIQFIKAGSEGVISAEDADVCELMCMLMQMEISEGGPLPSASKERKVLLSAKNIKKSYRSGDTVSQVLKGVSFDVFEGEFLCLLGESGCGKSTMLNIMGGLLDATEGSMKFLDQELVGLSEEELTKYRRDNIGFVFQSYNLMPNLNTKQNLDLIAELVDHPMDSIKALELVGLDQKANSFPSQLSGGQQQRISIARAIVKNPKIIFADEPTAALDYETSIEVLSVFQEIVKKGTTLIMVTHNEEITKMADRIIREMMGL